jgi:hypothetical protein
MKKITILTLTALVSCLSSYGQGVFQFTTSSSTAVWENFTTPGTFAKSGGTTFIGVMMATGQGTNAAPLTGTSATSISSTTPVAWSQVTGDPNYHLVLSGGTNLLATTGTGLSLGFINKGAMGIDGTQPGDLVKLYAIAWNVTSGANGFGTASFLGWSNPFFVLLGSSSGPGPSLSQAGMTAFGVSPTSTIPEPTTFALAGLGAAAMLIFRRRKS